MKGKQKRRKKDEKESKDGRLTAVIFNASMQPIPINLRLGAQVAELILAPQTILSTLIS